MFRKFMALTVNVIISLVTDLVVLYAVVTVHVTVVFASATLDGLVNLVIATILTIHV